jgi:hypothetical protein
MSDIYLILREISAESPNLPKSGWPIENFGRKNLSPNVGGQVSKPRAGFKGAHMNFKQRGVNSLGQLGEKFFGAGVVKKGIGKKANAYQDDPFQDKGVAPENDLAYQELLLCVQDPYLRTPIFCGRDGAE